MANKTIFRTGVESKVKPANTLNAAGGRAYKLSDEAALCQYVVTSCFNNTFYATADEQLDKINQIASNTRSDLIAKAAVYGHEVVGMKDTPAYLLAVLAARGKNDPQSLALCERIFPRVITNGKMLFNFVQVVRSGVTGRRSFGTVVKRAIRNWFASRTGNQLFTSSIGSNPSMADVIKMVHPKPESEEKKNFYAYLIGRDFNPDLLPPKVRDFEVFKQARQVDSDSTIPVPDVPFQMLTALNLTPKEWTKVILQMPWNALRMNLNTAARHGVFNDSRATNKIVEKLSDPEQIKKFNVFPYQLLAAYINTTDIPQRVRNALQDALEVATNNIPDFGVPVAVCIDTSGSMHSPITGHRKGSTTKVRCIDVAALVGASIARKNPDTILLPFDTQVHNAKSINPRDSIMTNAEKLARFGGGGTDCSAGLRVLNGQVGAGRPELIIYVSDQESWFNQRGFGGYLGSLRYGGTRMQEEWLRYKQRNPKAKLVLIDINAHDNTQVETQPDVFNIAGANDSIFATIANFVKSGDGDFVGIVDAVEI